MAWLWSAITIFVIEAAAVIGLVVFYAYMSKHYGGRH